MNKTRLVLPDGVVIEVTDKGYKCEDIPSLGKVLDFLYPVNQCPAVRGRQIGRNYGWRLHEAEKAILERNKENAGAGV